MADEDVTDVVIDESIDVELLRAAGFEPDEIAELSKSAQAPPTKAEASLSLGEWLADRWHKGAMPATDVCIFWVCVLRRRRWFSR